MRMFKRFKSKKLFLVSTILVGCLIGLTVGVSYFNQDVSAAKNKQITLSRFLSPNWSPQNKIWKGGQVNAYMPKGERYNWHYILRHNYFSCNRKAFRYYSYSGYDFSINYENKKNVYVCFRATPKVGKGKRIYSRTTKISKIKLFDYKDNKAFVYKKKVKGRYLTYIKFQTKLISPEFYYRITFSGDLCEYNDFRNGDNVVKGNEFRYFTRMYSRNRYVCFGTIHGDIVSLNKVNIPKLIDSYLKK